MTRLAPGCAVPLAAGLLALLAAAPHATAAPLAAPRLTAASTAIPASDHHRHRRIRHRAEAAPYGEPAEGLPAGESAGRLGASAGYSGPVPPGGFYNPKVNNGSFSNYAPNDPERPFGANSTVTAPPGTPAAEEQEINRRQFCNFSPERC